MSDRTHHLHGHAGLREVAVPVATVWTSPEAPRDLDEPAVRDQPDMAAWTAAMDAATRLDLHGRTLTQSLLGEPALVLEERGGWSKVAALWQRSSAHDEGYPGWVRTAHLGTPVERTTGPSAYVTSPSAQCVLDDGRGLALSCGTALWLDDPAVDPADDGAVRVLLPGGRRGTLALTDVRLSSKEEAAAYCPADLLATARQFLGVRYLWGGTSGWGMDCSGLVHLTFRTHGRLVPRDASDQAVAGVLEPVDLDAVEPGDLYFFARPGERVYHVGFVTRPVEPDGTRWMLHAPEGGELIEDAPMAADRVEKLVSAGRVLPG
jgi:cell wall-associated NlpC family hydrolase